MTISPSPSADRIRRRIDHPIIDADGHCLEYLPLVYDYLREAGGERVENGLRGTVEMSRGMARATVAERRSFGVIRPPWWAFPADNTLDRATAMLPGLLHARLDEIGIDFAVVYPTFGLIIFGIPDEEIRRASAHALNRYFVDSYGEYSDRLTPVATIPMHTPDEALAELDHAVLELGMKTVLMAGFVARDVETAGDTPRPMQWLDTFGFDSPYDYEPVWQRCVELGVSPTFHSSGMGWGSRMSPSSYVYNHLGNFAAGGEAACRGLFLDGVARRNPDIRFAFLEGGVAWAATLFSDIISHWDKRRAGVVERYDHRRVDRDQLRSLFARYGNERFNARLDDLDDALWPLSEPGDDDSLLDEFARSGIDSVEDIVEVFRRNFFFGCEADDRGTLTAFDGRRNPGGLRLNAVFSSDIGHWDVPDNNEVLAEAWELVEEGLLDEKDFRDFTFANATALYTANNTDFFRGTVVEGAAIEEAAR
ncbi:MAG TPA: amidohydrolase [Deltaproteobacteria bacterium]|nr:amidohydrolase [Candidatus Binatota bacterium]HIL13094.1 amidohydrolase [Deltaproteobacteria bacterium]